jgi:AcrR family transcriptional regulator
MAQRKEKERNPERSRAAILQAAERLFATKGYEATSLTDVGAAAGVSRGTPGYFFGSKPELYQAVLDHSFNEVREAVRAGRARALASSQTADAILAGAVSDYFDFLAARPNFVRLIEREALSGGGPGGARRDQRRAGTRRLCVGGSRAAPPQHHRPLLVSPGPCAHGGAGRRCCPGGRCRSRAAEAPCGPSRSARAARSERAARIHPHRARWP